jgi:hypothetical protein
MSGEYFEVTGFPYILLDLFYTRDLPSIPKMDYTGWDTNTMELPINTHERMECLTKSVKNVPAVRCGSSFHGQEP